MKRVSRVNLKTSNVGVWVTQSATHRYMTILDQLLNISTPRLHGLNEGSLVSLVFQEQRNLDLTLILRQDSCFFVDHSTALTLTIKHVKPASPNYSTAMRPLTKGFLIHLRI